MIKSNQYLLNVLTDHAFIKGIVNYTSLNTANLAKANLKLANIANYLSKYNINIWHILGTINIILDILLCLLIFQDNANKLDDKINILKDLPFGDKDISHIA